MSEALGYANAVDSGRRGGNGSRDSFQRLQPHRDGRLGSTKAGDLRVALLWVSVVIGLLLQALGGRPVLG